MTDRSSREGLVNENEFFNKTRLLEKDRNELEEGGYLKPALKEGDNKYYSEEQVALGKAMRTCRDRTENWHEAYEMAVEAISSKQRRTDRISEPSEAESKAAMAPKEIKTHLTFDGLLPIDDDNLKKITASMAMNGYFESEPIVLGKWPEQDEAVCIDGHTRIRAAIDAGINQVPVVIEEFPDEAAALEHTISLQTDRRKTDDRVKFRLVERFDSVIKRGGDRRSEKAKEKLQDGGKGTGRSASAHRTAARLGLKTRTVERIRTILRRGSPEIQDAVRNGKKYKNRYLTINSAHNMITGQGKRKTTAITVSVKNENLEALKALGGRRDHHINLAIERYIENLPPYDAKLVKGETDSGSTESGESQSDSP
jgi:hypothetical protein